MGNFNILMSTEFNSKDKCKMISSSIALSVLYNFICWGTRECLSIYIFLWTIETCSKWKSKLHVLWASKSFVGNYILWKIWRSTNIYIYWQQNIKFWHPSTPEFNILLSKYIFLLIFKFSTGYNFLQRILMPTKHVICFSILRMSQLFTEIYILTDILRSPKI